MHTRKTFLVYPPKYTPGDGYKTFKSLGKAKKSAVKQGEGTMIYVNIYKHEKKFSLVGSSFLQYVCEVV